MKNKNYYLHSQITWLHSYKILKAAQKSLELINTSAKLEATKSTKKVSSEQYKIEIKI